SRMQNFARKQDGMETIEHNSDKLTLSTQSKKPKESWLIEQLGLIAVRLGETVTAERLALYVDDLADLSLEQLERALWRARRELNFFPKIAEIRERAGADPEECQDAEAHRAWGVVVLYQISGSMLIHRAATYHSKVAAQA